MVGIFSVFEIMEPQENFKEEPYDLGEYKFTWLVITFPALYIYFIYIKHALFCNSHEIYFRTTRNSLL
jgi:hypothetical protein